MRAFVKLLSFILAVVFVGSKASAAPFVVPEPIVQQIAFFKSSGQTDLIKRAETLESLIAKLQEMKSPSLSESLATSDLDAATLKTLEINSKGVITVDDLKSLKGLEGGFSLGLSAQEGIYEMVSERFDLLPWTVAYPHFKINWHIEPNHTEIFLKKVDATGKPIVFLVPDLTLSYKGKSVTVDEFKWFLKDVKRMKYTYFVFGAYKMVTPELNKLREEAGTSKGTLRALFLRALGAESTNYDSEL